MEVSQKEGSKEAKTLGQRIDVNQWHVLSLIEVIVLLLKQLIIYQCLMLMYFSNVCVLCWSPL